MSATTPNQNAGQNTDPLHRLSTLEGVPSAFAATRDGIDVLLRDRGLRRTAAELTGESLLRGAHASAVLEGSAATWDDVAGGRMDEIAQASVRLSAEVLSLVPTIKSTPLQAFARLHAVVAGGQLDDEQLGRPRDGEAAERLRTLATTLTRPTAAPALVVAAIVHAELATAAPFASHNGIVARAAERLVLVARGVDQKSLLVPEAGHWELRPQYESNLRAYANAEGESGVHAWLLYAAEAQVKGVEASPLRRQ